MKQPAKSRKERFLLAASAIFCIAAFFILFGKSAFPIFQSEYGFWFDETQDFVKVLDVGEADSILIFSNGQAALIDSGGLDTVNEVCYDLAACHLKQVDLMLITHLHMDHSGAAETLVSRFHPENFVAPKSDHHAEADETILAAKSQVLEQGGKVYTAVRGMEFTIGEFTVTVLAHYPGAKKINNRSIIVTAKIGNRTFLFTGDAENAEERALLNEKLDLHCDVLKVAHHGAKNSSSEAFLKAALPSYAIISVGADNSYSHPSKETLTRLQKIGAEITRTDQNGDITFYIEKGQIRVETEK